MFSPGFLYATGVHFPRTFCTRLHGCTAHHQQPRSCTSKPKAALRGLGAAARLRGSAWPSGALARPSAPFFGRVGVVLRLRPLRSRAGGLRRCRRPLMSLAPPTPSPPLGVPFPVSAAAVAGRPPFPAGLF